MKISLHVFLDTEDKSLDMVDIEKQIELDFIPNVGDDIVDNGLDFKVRKRRVYVEGCVSLSLDQEFEIVSDRDKKEVLTRMKESGWYYRDPVVYDLLEL